MSEATRRAVVAGAAVSLAAAWMPPARSTRVVVPTAKGAEFRHLMVRHYKQFLADFAAIENPCEGKRDYYRLVCQLGADELAAFDRGEGEWWDLVYGDGHEEWQSDLELMAASDKRLDAALLRMKSSPDFPVFE